MDPMTNGFTPGTPERR